MGRRAEVGRRGQLAGAGVGLDLRALSEGPLRCGGVIRSIRRRFSQRIGGKLCIACICRRLPLPLQAPRKAVLRLYDVYFVGIAAFAARWAWNFFA